MPHDLPPVILLIGSWARRPGVYRRDGGVCAWRSDRGDAAAFANDQCRRIVGVDKYGGRVDAAVATRTIADVSAALLNGGFARAYDGGKRGSWC